MARNDKILERNDPRDERQYDELLKRAFQAKRKIETGFIELAESIFEIHRLRRAADCIYRNKPGNRQPLYLSSYA